MGFPLTISFFMSSPCIISTTKFQLQYEGVIYDRLPSSRSTLNPYRKTYAAIPASHASVEYLRQPSTDIHFHPRLWERDDFISSYESALKTSANDQEKHGGLKEEVERVLSLAAKDPSVELDLVDKIHQLGVGYQFETEIEDILLRAYDNQDNIGLEDLQYVSLRFRLLREAGFPASSDIFNKYTDDKGEFREKLVCDVRSMLNLYEASYLSIQGEYILDQAMAFTTNNLKKSMMSGHLSPGLALEVQSALIAPLHHCVERVHARHYISVYEQDESRNETLLEFAKLDFNILQLLHKKELLELTEWWDRLIQDVGPKLPFQFRDRIVEGYLINLSTNHEPWWSPGRMQQTKLWCAVTIIDDAHDVYGNIEELRPLCDALQRFLLLGVEDLDDLVDHMKVIFHEMVYLVKDIEADMIRKRHFIGIPYFKKEVGIYLKSLFDEAILLYMQELPTLEKWLPISTKSVAIYMFFCNAVLNMGKHATKEIFEWIDSTPDIINTVCLLIRLMADMSSFQLERERGVTASYQTCYMKEYGVSEADAIKIMQKKVASYWKDVNKALLRPTEVPRPVLKYLVGLVRDTMLYYRETDMYSVSTGRTKEIIASLLRDPIPV